MFPLPKATQQERKSWQNRSPQSWMFYESEEFLGKYNLTDSICCTWQQQPRIDSSPSRLIACDSKPHSWRCRGCRVSGKEDWSPVHQGDRMQARWCTQVHHLNVLTFLGFPLPGASKQGEILQWNSYRQTYAGRERNTTGRITHLAVRITFSQRPSQLLCSCLRMEMLRQGRGTVWWARAIPAGSTARSPALLPAGVLLCSAVRKGQEHKLHLCSLHQWQFQPFFPWGKPTGISMAA